jgi:ribosomal RNA-processing protein 1
MSEVASTPFLRSLADTEKETRAKALAFLQEWLRTHHRTLSESDLLRTWKGLFYTMWHADKRPVQQELAKHLAELMQCFAGSVDQGMLFVRCFFVIMQREWPGVDRFRKNKFYSLMSLMLEQMFAWVNDAAAESVDGGMWVVNDAAQPEWEAILFVLEELILKNPPDAIRYHITDVYLGSLIAAVGSAEEIDTDLFTSAIEPLLNAAVVSHMPVLMLRVKEGVLEPLLLDEQWKHIDLRVITQRVFTMASLPATQELHREALYTLYRRFKRHAQKRFPGETITIVAPPAAVPTPLTDPEAVLPSVAGVGAMEEEEEEEEAVVVAPVPKKKKKPAAKKGKKSKRKRVAEPAAEGAMFAENGDWSAAAAEGGASHVEATPAPSKRASAQRRKQKRPKKVSVAAKQPEAESDLADVATPANVKPKKKKAKKSFAVRTPGTRKSVRVAESNNTVTGACALRLLRGRRCCCYTAARTRAHRCSTRRVADHPILHFFCLLIFLLLIFFLLLCLPSSPFPLSLPPSTDRLQGSAKSNEVLAACAEQGAAAAGGDFEAAVGGGSGAHRCCCSGGEEEGGTRRGARCEERKQEARREKEEAEVGFRLFPQCDGHPLARLILSLLVGVYIHWSVHHVWCCRLFVS